MFGANSQVIDLFKSGYFLYLPKVPFNIGAGDSSSCYANPKEVVTFDGEPLRERQSPERRQYM